MKFFYWMIIFALLLQPACLYGLEVIQLEPYTRQYFLAGLSRPEATLTLSAELGGKVEEVLVDVGDTIGPGGVVAQLDSTFISLDYEKNLIEQQATIRQLELENKTTLRYQNLIDKNSAALAQYDEARARADVLEIRLKGLQNEEIRLKEQLHRHSLTAPPGWTVIQRLVEPGQYINQGQAIAELGNFNMVVVSYLLTVAELDLLRKTEPLTLYLPERDLVVDAIVYRISPDVDRESRKIAVDLLVSPSHSGESMVLRGGLRAELTLIGRQEHNVYLVPVAAIKSKYEANWLTTAAGEEVRVIVVGRVEASGKAIISGAELSEQELYRINSCDAARN
jgi:RND family efflux transporter MFP subunit